MQVLIWGGTELYIFFRIKIKIKTLKYKGKRRLKQFLKSNTVKIDLRIYVAKSNKNW